MPVFIQSLRQSQRLARPTPKPRAAPKTSKPPAWASHIPFAGTPKQSKPSKPTAAQEHSALEKSNALSPQQIKAANPPGTVKVKGNKAQYVGPNLRQSVGSDNANTLSLAGFADRVSRDVIGPNVTQALETQSFDPIINDPLGSSLELAGILPLGKVADAVKLTHEALLGGKSVEEAGSVARSVLSKANPQREINIGGVVAKGPKSRSGVLPHLQDFVDNATRKAIAKNPENPQVALRDAPWYVKANVKNLRSTNDLYTNRAERSYLEAMHSTKTPLSHQMALDMVAHETPPEIMKLHLQTAIKDATKESKVKALQKQLDALPEASALVKTVKARDVPANFATHLAGDHPTVILHENAPSTLHSLWNEMVQANRDRLATVRKLGILNPDKEIARLSAPGRVMRGARYVKEYGPVNRGIRPGSEVRINGKYPGTLLQVTKSGNALVRMNLRKVGGVVRKIPPQEYDLSQIEKVTSQGLKGAEDFVGGRIYIPSRREEKALGIGAFKPSEIVQNKLAKPIGFKGEYTGENRLSGKEDINAPKTVAEGGLSMQKYASGLAKIKELQSIALTGEKIPADLHDFVAVKLNSVNHNDLQELKNAMATIKEGEKPTAKAVNVLNKAFGGYLDRMVKDTYDASHLAESGDYGFVEKHLVGDIGNYDPTSAAERTFAGMSNFLKTLIVYTKLGHIPARYASNRVFNLMHMGISMFPSALKAHVLYKQFPNEARYLIKLSGHGGLESIADTNLQKALVGTVVKYADDPGRLTAMVYEIQKTLGGRMSVGQLAQMTQKLRDAVPGTELANLRKDIAQRGAVGAGEYSRLSKPEKKYLSKILFLWTWHRTAAVSTAKFALEHPFKAAAVGAGSYYLNEKVNQGKPPWRIFEAPLPSGKVSNLATALPFSTPNEDIRTLVSTGKQVVGGGNPVFGQEVGGQLNPMLTLMGELGFGRNLETGSALTGRLGAFRDIAKTMPPVALATGKAGTQDRILKFIFGNQSPLSNAPVNGAKSLSQKDINTLFKNMQKSQSAKGNASVFNNPKVQAELKKALKKLNAHR